MVVTVHNNLNDICKAISFGYKVLCIDTYCPDAWNVGNMRISEIIDALDNNNGLYIFIALED